MWWFQGIDAASPAAPAPADPFAATADAGCEAAATGLQNMIQEITEFPLNNPDFGDNYRGTWFSVTCGSLATLNKDVLYLSDNVVASIGDDTVVNQLNAVKPEAHMASQDRSV